MNINLKHDHWLLEQALADYLEWWQRQPYKFRGTLIRKQAIEAVAEAFKQVSEYLVVHPLPPALENPSLFRGGLLSAHFERGIREGNLLLQRIRHRDHLIKIFQEIAKSKKPTAEIIVDRCILIS